MSTTTNNKNALNRRFPVPEGFRTLLESLAREVLRGQPSDIYEFSALFFEKLLAMRKDYDINPVQDTEYYDKFKIQLFTEASKRHLVSPKLAISLGIALDEAKFVDTVPPRRNSAEKQQREQNVENVERFQHRGEGGGALHDLDRETQQHGSHLRSLPTEKKPVVEYLEESAAHRRRNEEDEFETDEFNDDTADRAATKIQAEIRGFLTRKNFERIKDSRKSVQLESSSGDHGRVLIQSHSMDAIEGMELDDDALAAATKIQAGIRGYLTRQKYNQAKTAKKQQKAAASKIQAGIRGHLTRKHLEAEGIPIHRKSRSPSPMTQGEQPSDRLPEKSESESESVYRLSGIGPNNDYAASKIQAGIRGYLTRKQLEQRGIVVHAPRRQSLQPKQFTEASFGIRDRSDTNPDAMAATKIQAGIRGYLTRKRIKQSHSGSNIGGQKEISEQQLGDDGDDEEGDENFDVNVRASSFGGVVPADEAATKIQAGVRSYLTRVNMKKQKQAATKIQSAFRGHQVRRDNRFSPTSSPKPSRSNEEENGWENVPSDAEA